MTTKQKWMRGLTSVASLMVALDVLVVSTALSTIRQHLHASIGQLEGGSNAASRSRPSARHRPQRGPTARGRP
jgi:hypothetical protein